MKDKRRRAGNYTASCAVDYSLRILGYLASLEEGRLANSREISAARNVPQEYLIQLMQPLRKAGLVTAQPGRVGGYALAREADQICIADIVEAIDGPSDSHTNKGAEAQKLDSLVLMQLRITTLQDLVSGAERVF